jgi:AraC-like DNA-binding protein
MYNLINFTTAYLFGGELKMGIDLAFSWCRAEEPSSFLVRRFLILESESPAGGYCDKHIPDGCCTLVFNFKGEVSMSVEHSLNRKLPRCCMALPYLGFVNIKAIPPIDTFGVACKTSVFSSFFHISLDDLETPAFRTIDDVIPHELYDKLKYAGTRQERIRLFGNFINEIRKRDTYKPDTIDAACEQIFSSNGMLHVDQLLSDLKMNDRTFRRSFCRRVGVTAKSLCRIVRANQVLTAMKESKEIDFQSIVFSSKYFDQPHFVNDFRKFVGESSGTFFNRDLRIVKLFSGL